MIANMTPEQVLATRARFELLYREIEGAGDAYYIENAIFELADDGFTYTIEEVNQSWVWFLHGSSSMFGAFMQLPSHSQLLSAADELRRIRQYSPCFTKAYDKREPVFVLRAQDEASPKALAQWLNHYQDILGPTNVKWISAKATLGLFVNHPNHKKAD